jgi:hypothetical protein
LALGGLCEILKDLGVSEADVGELVKAFQNDNYALIRAGYAKRVKGLQNRLAVSF